MFIDYCTFKSNLEHNLEPVKRCKRCNRKLKDAESRERGYGKVCYNKLKEDNAQQLKFKT